MGHMERRSHVVAQVAIVLLVADLQLEQGPVVLFRKRLSQGCVEKREEARVYHGSF